MVLFMSDTEFGGRKPGESVQRYELQGSYATVEEAKRNVAVLSASPDCFWWLRDGAWVVTWTKVPAMQIPGFVAP